MYVRRTSRRLRLGLAAGTLAVLGAGATTVVAQQPTQLLPDLHPQIPTHLALQVSSGSSPHVTLRFRSTVENIGAGPLTITGSRSGNAGSMQTTQVIQVAGGGTVSRKTGAFDYVAAGGHRHWHVKLFMAYELRTAGGYRIVRRGSRSGWCVRDDARTNPRTQPPPGVPASAVYTKQCGHGLPKLHRLRVGLSTGYETSVARGISGQGLDITTLKSGRYWLVQRVDPKKRIRQSSRRDDASSLLLQITWRKVGANRRRVTVTPVRACPTDDRCSVGVPPGSAATARTRR
jgi:hypothetical protein